MSEQTPTVERLLGLLPVHARARDEMAGGALRALLEAVAGELDVLEADIEELYASWFVETCPEWVVPYLGDLVGVTDLPPDLGAGAGRAAGSGAAVSRRAVVANTVAYRRRKGTVAVIEQVARDVTGWPARAVEYFRLLATTAHVNHVHLDRPATASVRDADALDVVPAGIAHGALNRLAHTGEVRRIAAGRGRYGIPNVGVFLFPAQVYRTGWAPARPPAAGSPGWSVHPLRYPTPLFAVPATEEAIERLAQEVDLPVPLRPRRLLALLQAARASFAASGSPSTRPLEVAGQLPVGVRIRETGGPLGEPLTPDRLRVCGLEGLAESAPGTVLDGWQVAVDALTGRLRTYLDGVPSDPEALHVEHAYGGVADVGAGSYDRSEVHAGVLADDPYTGDPARGGPGAQARRAVLADDPDSPAASTLAEALDDAETQWAATTGSPAGASYVVAIGDNGSYPGDLAVTLPEATRLVIVAAASASPTPAVYAPDGLRPHIAGTLTVTGGPGSSLLLDGLTVEGDVLVAPGALRSLTVSQCTVSGAIGVRGTGTRPNRDLEVLLLRSTTARVQLAPAVPLVTVRDSIVDAFLDLPAGTDPRDAEPAVLGAGSHLSMDGATVRGGVRVRTLDASSCVLDGRVDVEHRQTGCVRYSSIGRGSRVPRRFRCVPSAEGERAAKPVYASDQPGSPGYLELAATCPVEIAEGGEGGAEMGVHHHLQRPLRVHAAEQLLAPYVPVGLEIGLLSQLGELS